MIFFSLRSSLHHHELRTYRANRISAFNFQSISYQKKNVIDENEQGGETARLKHLYGNFWGFFLLICDKNSFPRRSNQGLCLFFLHKYIPCLLSPSAWD